MTAVEHYIKLLEMYTSGTMKVLEGIPEDRFEWRPWKGAFSFKGTIGHMISDELQFVRAVSESLGLPKPETEAKPKGTLREEVGRFWEIHRQTVSLVNSLRDEDLEKKVKMYGGQWEATIYEVLQGILEHQVHHRGQLVVYFRILGMEPPKRWEE